MNYKRNLRKNTNEVSYKLTRTNRKPKACDQQLVCCGLLDTNENEELNLHLEERRKKSKLEKQLAAHCPKMASGIHIEYKKSNLKNFKRRT